MIKKKINFKSSFSKAQFEIFKNKEKMFLRKKFNPPNFRDYNSIIKNNYMKNVISIDNLKIQKINIKSYKSFLNSKSYKIPYINGLSGELIIKNAGIRELKQIKNFIILYFKNIKNLNTWKKINNRIFYKKLEDIEKKIKINRLLVLFKKNKSTLEKIIKNIKSYPTGVCHGDLTLSNIIIDGKKIYLIDFLKTYNDNILQDISKIYQEFILGWSSRYLSDSEKLRAKIFCKTVIDSNFFKLFSNELLKYLYFEVLMTLFRIFPYVDKKDEITINWLINSINKVKKSRSEFY